MSTTIGLLGILAALIIMLYLSYRGMNTIYLAPVMVLLVCLTNGLPLVNSYVETYMTGFVGIIKTLFSFFLLGAILGRIFADTGAAASIAYGVLKITKPLAKTPSGKRLVAVISLIVIALILGYGGINALVLVFASYPIANSLAREVNIPRRFIPAWLATANCYVFCGPASPQTANVLAGQMLGTGNDSAMIPGLIAGVIIIGGAILYLGIGIERAVKNGENFTEHPSGNDRPSDAARPPVILSVLPILVVFITFVFLKTHIVVSLFFGIVLALILLYRYIPKEGNPIVKISSICNPAVQMAAPTIMALGALSGFGAVVQASPSFAFLAEKIVDIPGPPLLKAGLIVAIIVGFTSSAPAGLTIALQTFGPMFIGTLGVDPAALHRVAALSTSTFDSLPFAGGIITNLTLCGQTHKQAYKPIFIITVCLTFLAMVVCALLCTAFPGLV